MDNHRHVEDIQVSRKKRAHARAITTALVTKNNEALRAELMKIAFDRFDVKEICSMEMSDGKSPLRYAVTEAKGKTRMLQELKEKAKISFDVRFQPDQMTILHLAVRAQDKAVLKYLIKQGVKINSTDKNGETALHCAIRSHAVNICSTLLEANISIEKKDNQRRTALHVAVEPLISSAREKIELLCKKGASPNAIDSDGNTPLHLLMKRKPEDFLEKLATLMKYKAEPSMTNNDGKTALKLYYDHKDMDPEELQLVLNKLQKVPHSRSKSLSVLPAIVLTIHNDEPENNPGSSVVRKRASSFAPGRRLSGMLKRFTQPFPSKRRTSAMQKTEIEENESEFDGLNDEPLTDEEKMKRCAQFAQMGNGWQNDIDSETDCSISTHSDSPIDKYDYMTTDDESDYSRGGFNRKNSITSFRSRSSSRRKSSYELPKVDESSHQHGSLSSLPGRPRRITIATSLPLSLNRDEPPHESRRNRASSLTLDGECVVDEQLAAIWKARPRDTSLTPSDQSYAGYLGASDADISSCSSSRKNSQEIDDRAKLKVKTQDEEKSPTLNGLRLFTAEGSGDAMQNGYPQKISNATVTEGGSKVSTTTLTLQEAEEAGDELFALLDSMNEEECLEYLKNYKEKELTEVIDTCNGEHLLHMVARREFPRVFHYLMIYSIDLNCRDGVGWTSVHITAELGHLDMLKLLINNRADREAVTYNGDTALGIAISNNRTSVATYLLEDTNMSASYLELSLYRLVRERRRKEATNLFINHIKTRINSGDKEVHRVLPIAAKLQHWNVITFLLKQRHRSRCLIHLDRRDADGYCAVHYACLYDNPNMLSKLHDAGASLKKRKRQLSTDETAEVTPLTIAKDNGFDAILDVLKASAQRKKSSNTLLVPSG